MGVTLRLLTIENKEYFRYEDEDSGAILWLPIKNDSEAYKSITGLLNKHYNITTVSTEK